MQAEPLTIVLFGVKGSGKDTIGDYLQTEHSFVKESFAWPIKQMAKLAFPAFTDEDLFGSSENRERFYEQYRLSNCPWCGSGLVYDKYGSDGQLLTADEPMRLRCEANPDHTDLAECITPRFVLKTLGTQWGRSLCSDIWVNGCLERIVQKRKEQPNLQFVVTDGRFTNELIGSKRSGAHCVKLTRGLVASTDAHQSEAEFRVIPDVAFDVVLDNANFTLDELPQHVDKMLETSFNAK